ncbi:hypothetical protein [Sansalvadorimonas verongulae]|uniref:hypothetical protein n=1 Tax=Sansalvadorimonas verongulae TaxID=2172824 RepID=UPI0012BCD89C|nr:hypothetical protein [Sansalvadorimonas verongulae]MTI14811.1 hypothetical protein [Sansalvadorimonas verongulae]
MELRVSSTDSQASQSLPQSVEASTVESKNKDTATGKVSGYQVKQPEVLPQILASLCDDPEVIGQLDEFQSQTNFLERKAMPLPGGTEQLFTPSLARRRGACRVKKPSDHPPAVMPKRLDSLRSSGSESSYEGESFSFSSASHQHLEDFKADALGDLRKSVSLPVCGGGFLVKFVPAVFNIVAHECVACEKRYQNWPKLLEVFGQLQLALKSYIPQKTVVTPYRTRVEEDAQTDAQRIIQEMKSGMTNYIERLRYLDREREGSNIEEQVAEIPGALFSLWLPALSEAIVKKLRSLVTDEGAWHLVNQTAKCAEKVKKITTIVKGKPNGLAACVEFYKHYMGLIDRLVVFFPKGELDIARLVLDKAKSAETLQRRERLVAVHDEPDKSEGVLNALTYLRAELQAYEDVLNILLSTPHLTEGNPCGQDIIEAANALLEYGMTDETRETFAQLVRSTEPLGSNKVARVYAKEEESSKKKKKKKKGKCTSDKVEPQLDPGKYMEEASNTALLIKQRSEFKRFIGQVTMGVDRVFD